MTASRTWGDDDADVVGLRFDAEIELATLDQALGDLDAAERRLLDALTAARRMPFAERSVASGLLWAQRGIDIRSALGDAAIVDLARDYAGLAALQHLAGDLTHARGSYARAERQLTAALGPDHHEVAVVLVNRAALESDTGNAAAACRLYRRALTSLRAALGPDHYEVQFVEANLLRLL